MQSSTAPQAQSMLAQRLQRWGGWIITPPVPLGRCLLRPPFSGSSLLQPRECRTSPAVFTGNRSGSPSGGVAHQAASWVSITRNLAPKKNCRKDRTVRDLPAQLLGRGLERHAPTGCLNRYNYLRWKRGEEGCTAPGGKVKFFDPGFGCGSGLTSSLATT